MRLITTLALAGALSCAPIAVLAAAPPSITNTVGVCDPNAATNCVAPDSSGHLPVSFTGGLSITGPVGTVALGATVAMNDIWWAPGSANAAALSAGTGTFGALGMPPGGVAIGGADSVTGTTLDKVIINNGDNGLQIHISGGSIGNLFELDTTAQSTLSVAGAAPAKATGVQGVSGGTPVPVSGTVTANVTAVTTGGATPYHFISTASTNATLVSTGAHTLYALALTGLNTTAGYVRLYDLAGAPTCSSATGAISSFLVIGSATAQGGMVVPIPAQGILIASGLGFCITGGSADTDNTSGPAGILVNAAYK